MYKIKNKLEQPIRYKDIVFAPKETKILEEEPTSDKFHTEKIESKEKPNKLKGGKK